MIIPSVSWSFMMEGSQSTLGLAISQWLHFDMAICFQRKIFRAKELPFTCDFKADTWCVAEKIKFSSKLYEMKALRSFMIVGKSWDILDPTGILDVLYYLPSPRNWEHLLHFSLCLLLITIRQTYMSWKRRRRYHW